MSIYVGIIINFNTPTSLSWSGLINLNTKVFPKALKSKQFPYENNKTGANVQEKVLVQTRLGSEISVSDVIALKSWRLKVSAIPGTSVNHKMVDFL